MCNPVSMIVKSDGSIFLPANDAWNHSHTAIAALHGIPDGEMGDRYGRVEVTPPAGVSWRDIETNAVNQDTSNWNVVLDERRAPSWWSDDKAAFEDKCRKYAARYMKSVDQNLVPGRIATGGYGSTLTGGDESTLTGGYGSTLTGGYRSTLTGGDGSTLVWKRWDGTRYRLHLFYTGENGCKANTNYRCNAGTLEEVTN